MKIDINTIKAIKQYVNKLQGNEMMSDYLIPLIIDENMNTAIKMRNMEEYSICRDDINFDYRQVEYLEEFLESYTIEMLKMFDKVLTSFEDDDIMVE